MTSHVSRVLLVDDSAVVRNLISQAINAESDLEVVATAGNGEIAIRKMESVDPDIVVLDINMPVMDGLEALAAMRALRPKLPIIMFSTLTERGAEATIQALSLGATDYATKPSGAVSSADRYSGSRLPLRRRRAPTEHNTANQPWWCPGDAPRTAWCEPWQSQRPLVALQPSTWCYQRSPNPSGCRCSLCSTCRRPSLGCWPNG
jgi:two-component system, chemotaxis family, protein-glutamate methylesterase/glutaminase